MERPRAIGEEPTLVPAELIERIYASALEPGRYDDLMRMWQQHVETALEAMPGDIDAEDVSPPRRLQSDELERHFLRAFSILERLGRSHDDAQSVEALIEVQNQPSLLVEPDGRIASANVAAKAALGIKEGDTVEALAIDVDGLRNLKAALASLASQQPSRLIAVARISMDDGSGDLVLALSRAERPDGAPPLGLLTVADLAWSLRIGEVLSRAFGLTETECDIARALVSGETAREIAQTRGRSLETVRSQVKSVLRKVDVHSQSELIRLTAALVQLDMRAEAPTQPTPALPTSFLMRPGRRRLFYSTIGPEDGRPVLFIHGMLDGHGITARCNLLLEERKIRLICPVRPHFGASDPDGGPKGAPDRVAKDIAALLDHLGVQRVPVIGHMAGSVYAFAAARHLGDRVSGILCVSGGVPIVSHEQFAMMTPRQRIVAYTARYTPTLLPLILRAGIALLDSGGSHAFMKALYENAPVDYRIASRPDVFPILASGYKFTVEQGHGAFEVDSRQVTRDWSHYVDGTRQRVVLVHGRHDPVVRIRTVTRFAERYPGRVRLREVTDEGQLLFYSVPELVFDELETLFA